MSEPISEQRGIKRGKRASIDETSLAPRDRKRQSLDETALHPRDKRRREDIVASSSQLADEKSSSDSEVSNVKAKEPVVKVTPYSGEDPNRPVRVYADGIYDLFHFGHARSLEQAKKLFPNTYLIVGVCNDDLTHRLKGRTVMNDKERGESLRHCKWVDEVVEDAPWIVTADFIDKHKIDYVAHGQDIIVDENGDDIYEFVKARGQYKTIKRTDGISTSDIILRIVKDYDSYVRRNYARGYTGKQMNIGFVKEKQLQMEQNIKKFKEKMQDSYDKVQKDFQRGWSKSQRIVEFLKKFGGRVEKLVGLEDSGEYDSDDLTGFASPDHHFYSPDENYVEEEQPPHV